MRAERLGLEKAVSSLASHTVNVESYACHVTCYAFPDCSEIARTGPNTFQNAANMTVILLIYNRDRRISRSINIIH